MFASQPSALLRTVARSLPLLLVLALVTPVFAQDEVETRDLTIEMGSFYFQVEGQERNAPIELEAGTRYEITFRNVDTMLHEVLIGRNVVMVDGAPDGYEVNPFAEVETVVEGEGWEVEAEGFVELELEGDREITIVMTVPSSVVGEWEMGCFVPGHYEAGMKAPLTVR